MDYRAKHAEAYRKIKDKGSRVVFERGVAGEYDELTDTFSEGVDSEVPGYAVEIPGDPEEFEALELIGKNPVTLMFAADVFGAIPNLNDTVSWAGRKGTVHSLQPLRPAEVVVTTKVILL